MTFPPPLIIPPLKQPHHQTFIILHGRGSSAQKFGPSLLATEFAIPGRLVSSRPEHKPLASISVPVGSSEPIIATCTLPSVFPHAKFIFPTAPRTRATLYKRAKTNQWFDNWILGSQANEREELQAPGLKQTVTYLHGLLKSEIDTCPGGSRNVILWGLSQGCAASLVSLLLWDNEDMDPLGGVVGMCGWLPYTLRIEAEMGLSEERDNKADGEEDDPFHPFEWDAKQEMVDDGEDPFERSVGEEQSKELDPAGRAIEWLRTEIELDQSKEQGKAKDSGFKPIPVFLGHGVEDGNVSITLGRTAFSCLTDLGVERAEWKEYEGLGHWYSAEMLSDIVDWIWRETGWKRTG
ncbi:alpha/beta-hydrolase [Rhypophila decipiens]|uniref:Alpha/beta-hydrolase n=1 Tax=Rhypophila decipiens TaxID=261697 RepID=A0AAN7B6J3_9PEZI|nr:alpha/beta-hydrolase [Rhypophila decipiens]